MHIKYFKVLIQYHIIRKYKFVYMCISNQNNTDKLYFPVFPDTPQFASISHDGTLLLAYSAQLRIWAEFKTVGWTKLVLFISEWIILNKESMFSLNIFLAFTNYNSPVWGYEKILLMWHTQTSR